MWNRGGVLMETDEVIETLKSCQLLSELSDAEISRIASRSHIEDYLAGEAIYHQGDRGQKLFVLSQGQVSLNRRFALSEQRTAEKTVYVARSGLRRDVLGCWCALVGQPHEQMCSAICDRPTKVVSIPCTDLREVLVQDPQLGMKVIAKIVVMLRERIEFSYGVMEHL